MKGRYALFQYTPQKKFCTPWTIFKFFLKFCKLLRKLILFIDKTLKVAYTSGPIFEKIIKRYPIFSVQIINYQIDQKHK